MRNAALRTFSERYLFSISSCPQHNQNTAQADKTFIIIHNLILGTFALARILREGLHITRFAFCLWASRAKLCLFGCYKLLEILNGTK